MSGRFDTAQQLMEHVKKQLVDYMNDGTYEKQVNKERVSTFNQVDETFGEMMSTIEYLNNQWKVSAEKPITSHRKFSGKIIIFFKKVIRKTLRWYVSETFDKQMQFNASVTKTMNELRNVLINMQNASKENQNHITNVEKMCDTVLTTQNEITKLEEEISQLKYDCNHLKSNLEFQITALKDGNEELRSHLKNIESTRKEDIDMLQSNFDMIIQSKFDQIGHIINQNDCRLIETTEKIEKIKNKTEQELNYLNYKIRQEIRNKLQSISQVNIEEKKENLVTREELSKTVEMDYLHFENRFRGSVEEIKKRQTVYLKYYSNKQDILDIGCGRGEFLELLLDNNISATGIDMNVDMVNYCQDRGLPVVLGDGIAHLKEREDNSLGGIFLGQVIEHLNFEQILDLVDTAYCKLKNGSYIIMETPNPLSLAIFYRTFYVDPTHVKPIHPLTIKYVVESVGFRDAELKYSSRVEPNWWLPRLEDNSGNILNLEHFNAGIDRINDMLYGYLDYAIIAKK
ncbi:methyltransferase domain-containing protein [Paenibacillus dendritiformis]|uniref:class I SAM-dependent methyltransferase n=1 Tax=Paenibacillus dendritiformis TaxID=130049 RepID=UPI00105A8F9F|nr:methionine biosynthesis protein MetW [Paenibacillus dendritiformis]TDL51862.1 methyltransferase domain-containing protein [Paenibacillus dendritiformis]